MPYSANDYAADTLSLTLETIEEARERAETDEELAAIDEAEEAVEDARETILEREGPTPTQQLVEHLEGKQ